MSAREGSVAVVRLDVVVVENIPAVIAAGSAAVGRVGTWSRAQSVRQILCERIRVLKIQPMREALGKLQRESFVLGAGAVVPGKHFIEVRILQVLLPQRRRSCQR